MVQCFEIWTSSSARLPAFISVRIEVADQSPPSSLVLHIFSQQSLLSQVIPASVHSPLLWSSFPSPSPSISFPFLFSDYVSMQHDPAFLHFLGYFYFHCPSNTFVPYSIQFYDSTHTSQHPHFYHLQLLTLFLHSPCLGPVHHCWY